VTLWEMLTGKTPFRGTPGEVLYQHQHTPLPLEQLKGIPPPIIALLEVLLEKDPGRRFQNPAELLKAIPTITGAIGARRRITHQSLHNTGPAASPAPTRKPSSRPGPKKISVARLPVTGSDVFGREEDIAFLDRAWANKNVNVLTIVAWAGVGKSTLVNHWLRQMAAEQYRSAQLVFGWSFYRQGTSGGTSSADEFFDAALSWFGDPDPRIDVRQGAHARKVMASYQSWFGEGPELSVLRILGFFDRPADGQALEAVLKPPAIPGLTESLTGLSHTQRRTILARLRRARLLAEEDPQNPGQLDTHPLVREYFGEQLRSQHTAWKEGNRRLYHHYRALAPHLPDSVREMEPLFLPLSAAARPVCFMTPCIKFTFRGFNEAMPPMRQRFSDSEEQCFRS
jgi:hypothetical protein